MRENRSFSYTALQKTSYGFLTFLQFNLLIFTFVFLPLEYWTLFIGLSLLQIILWVQVVRSFYQSCQTYEFQVDKLVVKGLFQARSFPYDSFLKSHYNPGKGFLSLETTQGNLKVHNSLHKLGVFKNEVQALTPAFSKVTGFSDPVTLKVVRGVWPFYFFFLGAIVIFGYLMDPLFSFFRTPWGWLFGGLLSLLALTMILRSFFYAPVSYLLSPDYIEVTYLLRKKRHYYDQVLSHGTDLYAHGGAEYFLVKALFQNGNVVLDELFLDQELQPLSAAILERFKPL